MQKIKTEFSDNFVYISFRSSDSHLFDFPMTVNMKFLHNHPILSADVLRSDVSDEVKEKFTKLFESDYSPSTALEIHKMDGQMEYQDEDLLFVMADRAKVPDRSWCYR